MTPIEKDELVKSTSGIFPFKTGLHSIDDVLEVILPYVDLKAGISKQKLRKILKRKSIENWIEGKTNVRCYQIY